MLRELQNAIELQIFWDSFIFIGLLISFFTAVGLFFVLIYTDKYRNLLLVGCTSCCGVIYFLLVWNFVWPLVYGFPK